MEGQDLVWSWRKSEVVIEIVQRYNPSQQQTLILAFDEHLLAAA